MKFRATFSSVGVQWLERFVPVFEKLGNELTMLLTRNTIHLVQDAVSTGGLELHADLLKNEVFEEYKISSNNEDKIAFSLEPAVLHRVLKGLIGSEATSVDVKLIKRVISPGNAAPFLNFTSKGLVDITQDVPLAGPLTKREVCVLETLITANVVDVLFWLNLDRAATDTTHVTVEKFKAIGGVVELATTKQGALHLVVQSSEQGAAVIGVELQNLPVLPDTENARNLDDGTTNTDDITSSTSRLAHAKASGNALCVKVDTKHLWKSLSGTASNPSDCLFGVARNKNFVELVYRFDRQAVNGNDAVGLMVRVPVLEDDDVAGSDFDE